MSYLVNSSRLSSLTINGVDYTSSLVSWTASDASANKNGLIDTTGQLVLGQLPGGYDVEDYNRNDFKRGTPVILDISGENGAAVRHPRGYLYVMETSYDVESEQLLVGLGCRIALAGLTDESKDIVDLSPIELDETQQTLENAGAAFAATGQCLYQNNQGELVATKFFDGDGFGTAAAGEWVSILGTTAISVSPLAAGQAIPDAIKLTYQVPADTLNDDKQDSEEVVETFSYYFVAYPAYVATRINEEVDDETDEVIKGDPSAPSFTATASSSTSNSCGNLPDEPGDNSEDPVCSEDYNIAQMTEYIPAIRRQIQTTKYTGPGAQVGMVVSETYGMAIEANAGYFGDKFSFCRTTWANACNPNGGCPFDGTNEILLERKIDTNEYGEANELVRTISDTWVTRLSAAQTSDWRSGLDNGTPQDFNQSFARDNYELFRVQRQVRESYQKDNANFQDTTTFSSVVTRGGGITGVVELDALSGIKTMQRRISTTITSLEVRPDTLNSPSTNTRSEESEIPLFTGRFMVPPPEAGPYVVEEQVPVPLLSEDEGEIESWVDDYSQYLTGFVKGDAFGLQIAEALRSEVVSDWRPGMPFRYYDPRKDKLMAMRMDACTWGVDAEGAALVVNGIWVGNSNGTVSIPNNVVGASRPDMSGPSATFPPYQNNPTPTPTPPPGTNPPSVDDETTVDSGALAWVVSVDLSLQASALTYGNDGIVPPALDPQEVQTNLTFTAWCTGFIVTSGDLAMTDPSGSIPSELGGSLITDGATLVVSDLFS